MVDNYLPAEDVPIITFSISANSTFLLIIIKSSVILMHYLITMVMTSNRMRPLSIFRASDREILID
jgi:hypothetical protein